MNKSGAPQLVLELLRSYEGSEYVLRFEIGQWECGFYSGRTVGRQNHPVTHQYIDLVQAFIIWNLCFGLKIRLELFTVEVVYHRPGSNFEQFLLEYIELVRSVCGENCFLCGDFNLHLLRYENLNIVQSFNSNLKNSFYS